MTAVDSNRHSRRAVDASGLDAPTVRIEIPQPRRVAAPAAPARPAAVAPVPAPAPVAPAPIAPAPIAAAPAKRRRWPWVVAAGVGGLIVIASANGGTPAAPTAATTPSGAAAAAPAASAAQAPAAARAAAVPATVSSGTYQVGTDLAPGRYKTAGGSFCGWSRDKADDGQLDSIIANDILQGPGSVTVKPTDKFVEFSGDCTWTKQ